MSQSNSSKILFFMTGSIAAVKACQVLSQLVKDGHDVQVVATHSTFRFIGEATLEGLSGKKVLSDLWESGRAMDHIHLSRWADFGVICPASANTLAKLAVGLSDDLVSAMILAWPTGQPLTVFPAMNQQMFLAAPTQDNLRKLEQRGFAIAPTQSGPLACGEEGWGRMLEVETVVDWIFGLANTKKTSSTDKDLGSVLITGGATREPIDGIRFLSNVSTGQTAATLATQLSSLGWDVTYLHGVSAEQPARTVKSRQQFGSFHELNERLQENLASKKFVAVIHCAAVSDYSVADPQIGAKISSDTDLNISLKRNFKILPRLKEYSANKNICVIGFKLTLNQDQDGLTTAAQKILADSVDAVVANDWSQVTGSRPAVETTAKVQSEQIKHPGFLITRDGGQQFSTLSTLGNLLNELISKRKELP